MVTKECRKCKIRKEIEQFSNEKRMKDGKSSLCKECKRFYNKEYKKANKDRLYQYNKKYRDNNKEKIRGYYKLSDDQKMTNRRNRQKKYFDQFVKIVSDSGGTCLGSLNEYKNARNPILVKCRDGHKWKISLNNAKRGRWCPKCKMSIGEMVSLEACNFLFNTKFKKVRPDWLKNKNGNNLELDIYNEELSLAVEYNGRQHYEYVPFFHNTMEIFRERAGDDELKYRICKERGVNLIIVPYTVGLDEICHYIEEKAKEIGFVIKNFSGKFDYKNIRVNFSHTQTSMRIIEEKGGYLLDGACFTLASRITVMCKKRHIWKTSTKLLKRGSWCKECKLPLDKNPHVSEPEDESHNEDLHTEIKKSNLKDTEQTLLSNSNKQKNLKKEKVKTVLCTGECGKEKPITEFTKSNKRKSGHQPWCRQCMNKYKLRRRQLAKEANNTYKCDVNGCGREYALKDSLTRHKKEKH